MSEDACQTDSTCCYQDDSGAAALEKIVVGLAAALVLSLLAHLVALVAWKRASRRRRSLEVSKEGPPPLAANTVGTSLAAGSADVDGRAAGAGGAASVDVSAAEEGRVAPSYAAAVAAPGDPAEPAEAGGENGSAGRRTAATTASPDDRQQLQLTVVEESPGAPGGERGGHIIRTTKKDQQLRRSNSGASLRSLRSVGSLNDMHQLGLPGPPSPASTTAQEDILRLRSLLDTERSRRVAAESALGGAGAAPTSSSRPRNGSGACTPTSMGGTPRSRSYSGLHKSAMARAVEAHALGGTSTPKSHHGGCVGAGGGGGIGLGTPSNSFGNLANMGGTPRAPRLSYSALQKFPSARTVEAHALEAAANGARWVQTAFAKASGGGGKKKEELRRASDLEQLPSIISSILAHLFSCCRAEVKRRLQARVDGLRAFVGGTEVVQLGGSFPTNGGSASSAGGGFWGGGGGGGGPKSSMAAASAAGAAAAGAAAAQGMMAPDTQELLYGELRRRHRTIAALGKNELVALMGRVLSHALDTEPRKEIGRGLVHQTWPVFEPVVRSYLALFVECALQQPQIEFEETAGREEIFDPETHRELARLPSSREDESPGGSPKRGAGPGLSVDHPEEKGGGGGGEEEEEQEEEERSCCIVFPAIVPSIARWPPSDAARSGVIVF